MTYIISLGGSLIAPASGIDTTFLKKFRSLVLKQVKKGDRFIIITGGGNTCRYYNSAAMKVAKITDRDLDWIGIGASRLNANLIKGIFSSVSSDGIIKDPTKAKIAKNKVLVAGGWKPGWSTDYVSAKLADKYSIKTVINLSNIDYAYDKDPKKYKNAKKIETTNWKEFRKIVGNKWEPGLNMPFDPIASKLAQELKLKVVIMNGKNLKNLENCLNGKLFKGTVIE